MTRHGTLQAVAGGQVIAGGQAEAAEGVPVDARFVLHVAVLLPPPDPAVHRGGARAGLVRDQPRRQAALPQPHDGVALVPPRVDEGAAAGRGRPAGDRGSLSFAAFRC